MPNMSDGLLYVATKEPHKLHEFYDRREELYRTDITAWNGGSLGESIEYLGDGKYLGRFTISCAWSCLGCCVNEMITGYDEPNNDYITIQDVANHYGFGILILAEENSFSEIISITNTGVVEYEQPDIHYYSHEDDEDHTFEIKYEHREGWYLLVNGEEHPTDDGFTYYWQTSQEVISVIEDMGAVT